MIPSPSATQSHPAIFSPWERAGRGPPALPLRPASTPTRRAQICHTANNATVLNVLTATQRAQEATMPDTSDTPDTNDPSTTPITPTRAIPMPDQPPLTIAEAARQLCSGALTAVALTQRCLDRIAQVDGELRAC